jgi:hypothetical protein
MLIHRSLLAYASFHAAACVADVSDPDPVSGPEVVSSALECEVVRSDDADCDGRDDDCDGSIDEDCTALDVFEVGVGFDDSYLSGFASEADAFASAEALVSQASALLERDGNIAVRLVFGQGLHAQAPVQDGSKSDFERLTLWGEYRKSHPVFAKLDAALLFTGQLNVGGLAFVNGACLPSSHGVVKVGDSVTRVARYLAMLLGAAPDLSEGCPQGFIMGSRGVSSLSFSSCSIEAFEQAREEKTCLDTQAPEAPDCSDDSCPTLEIGVVATAAYRSKFGSDQAALNTMNDAVAGATAIMERDSGVRVKVVFSELAPSAASIQQQPNVPPEKLLSAFKAYRNGHATLAGLDGALLFAAQLANDPAPPGMAMLAGACTDNAVALVHHKATAGVTARYLSMLLGAKPDALQGCADTFVLGSSALSNDTLSTCSVASITEAVAKKSCL